MKNCAVYARYSSHAQNDASIEQQIAECEAYAEQNHLKVVATFADRAMSGRSDRRPEFQRLMRAAEKKSFDVVLAYKSNRIARNMLHALSYEDKLAKLGVEVIYCKEEFGNNAAGRFALRTMMNVNQFYSENMAEDIMRGMLDNAQQCRINGSIPYGYKRGEDGKYAIDEAAAAIVREVFRRIANGDRKSEIAEDLNARGIRTRLGNKWTKATFNNFITNERYTGVYIYKDVRIPGGIPAIIDQDLFTRAQIATERTRNVVKSRRRRSTMEYLLTGKLFCGHCKSAMVGSSGTGRNGTMHYYYRCRNNAEQHTCDKKPVRKDDIERLVVEALRACVTRPENIQWMTDLVMKYRDQLLEDSQLSYLESRLSDNKTALRNVMKAIEAGIITETTKARMEELEAEQKQLLADILVEKRAIPPITRDHVEYYFASFRDGEVTDRKYQKLLIDHFLRAVYLYDDHLKLYFSYTDSDDGIAFPLGTDPPPDTEGKDVLINGNWGHHTFLIRTPATLQMVGRVFLLSVHFAKSCQ